MPNVSRNLEPRFEGEIDAEIIDFEIDTVSDNGYAHVENDYEHHLIAWAPFEDGAQLKTTSYNQQRKERTQTYAQKSDGGVNIGTEEWAGERIVMLILDRKITEE
jgi:hypothetical protein